MRGQGERLSGEQAKIILIIGRAAKSCFQRAAKKAAEEGREAGDLGLIGCSGDWANQ